MTVYNTPKIYEDAILKALQPLVTNDKVLTPIAILSGLELKSKLAGYNNKLRDFELLLPISIKIGDFNAQLIKIFGKQPQTIIGIEYNNKFGYSFTYDKNILK